MTKYKISVIATILAVLITSYFIYMMTGLSSSTGPFPLTWSINLPEEDTAFGGLFYESATSINDSLPHYEYQRKLDSLKKISDDKKLLNKSFTSGVSYGSFGFSYMNREWIMMPDLIRKNDPVTKLMDDSINAINNKWALYHNNADSIKKFKEMLGEIMWRYNVRSNEILQEKNSKAQKDYYLTLNGYSADYDTKFFIQNGKFNLAYVKWDSVVKRKFDSTKVGHYERKQIPVRYSADDKKVLIPLSKGKYDVYKTTVTIFSFISIFLLIYIFIGLPIQIIVDLSKGKAFTKQNIRRFKLMAFVLFICTFLKVFSPYILQIFYRNIIPKEFTLEPMVSAIVNNIYLFLIALVLFFIGKAFQKGYGLQEEEDLTV